MNKLIEFKNLLKQKNIDAYIVPKYDMFFSEELLEVDERLKYISNFSGSAGWGVILASKKYKSAIISDGRYQEQLKIEVSQKEFIFFNGGIDKIIFFLEKQRNIKTVSIDSKFITFRDCKYLKNELDRMNVSFLASFSNLIDYVWKNKPEVPKHQINKLDIKYIGESFDDKFKRLLNVFLEKKADAHITFKPDDVSWIFNIRDNQLKYTPVVRCFALIHKNQNIYVFFERDLPSFSLENKNVIHILNFKKLNSVLKKFNGDTFLIDYSSTPAFLIPLLKKNKINIKETTQPIPLLKTIKNQVEQKHFREVHQVDGLAFLNFWKWFENLSIKNLYDEETLSKKLFEFRSKNPLFKSNSFPTISAYGKNGSIIHYRYKKGGSSKIKSNNLYLVDSGGQYLNGTTDITRVLIHGVASKNMKQKYTYVLKGHLALSKLIFPEGTKGKDIDCVARLHLWERKLDYPHGTGHGVGFYLNVHEGPVSISKSSLSELKPGMVISNEPGYYGPKFGVRIENLELIKKVGNFLKFETLTLVPYEKKLIDINILTKNEIKLINQYHSMLKQKLLPLISKKDKDLINFLNRKTSSL